MTSEEKMELKEGMKDATIYNIIDEKISGEGSEQVLTFMFPRGVEGKDKPETLHEVIKTNRHFGIIKKFKTLWNQTEYYLTGISDEEKYFIHPIPKELVENNKSIDTIVNDINRKDENFASIQGDILVKFIDIDSLIIDTRGTPKYVGFWHKKLLAHSLFPERAWTVKPDGYREELFTYSSYHSDGIGNHAIIIKNGKMLGNPNDTQKLIFGESFTLEHNEHKIVHYDIPKYMVALLSMQKGSQMVNSD